MLLVLLSLLTALSAEAETRRITRALLFQGNPIPESRSYPISPTVNACEDFHKHVCGEVENSFELPANRSGWTFAMTDGAERLLYAKKRYFRLLQQGYSPRSNRARQVKDYFLGCMNVDARSREERSEVEKQMHVANSLQSSQDLMRLLGQRYNQPDFSIVEIFKISNQDDPDWNDLGLMPNAMSLPEKSYYEREEVVNNLKGVALKLFQTIGADQPEQRAQWVIDFEKAFARLAPTPAEIRNRIPQRNYRSREDLLRRYPHLELDKLFALLPARTQLRDFTPETMAFLSEALEKEPLEKLKSVLLFHGLKDVMDDAYPEYFAAYYDFRKRHFGESATRRDREERCIADVMTNFGMEMDQELLPILFPNFPTQRVVQLAEAVRSSILQGIRRNSWLSAAAKEEAIRKVEVAALQLVKPAREQDWNFLPIQRYQSTNPLANKKRVQVAQITKIFRELAEKRNRSRWSSSPLTVNAYYSPSDNRFVLLQGILQPPLFSASAPEAENIAAIGMVVGHELGHGIDDKGAEYDSRGRVRKWMTEQDLSHFRERGSRFVERFNRIGHNGDLTLGENIGDHVGLTFAFEAAFPNGGTDQVKVKDFFRAYARTWCSKMRPEYEQRLLRTDSHAMGWARINEQVVHLDGFQNAFACKPGDRMYVAPGERIRVW